MSKEYEKYVNIDGVALYTKVIKGKKDSPVIIMDAGYGDYSKAWYQVAERIIEYGTVLLYDRAGLGKSEKSPNARISSEMVKELKELLQQLQLKPPYILIGHSFGGINVRLFASFYPEETAGLILIDSTPENYRDDFLPIMSPEFQEAYYKQFIYEGTYEEFMSSLYEAGLHCKSIGNIPLVIVAAGKKAFYSSEAQVKWLQMQKELLQLSNNHRLIIAPNSGHYIQRDEPEYVIEAARWVLSHM
ncbi:alpha/beta hydrolase [Paenibacillus sp. 102]|uniref:alpha/beta fold hydrolase n=1 Tax=Paenibacillus sp. 102 TaxID=3120823 RepID=UPI0031BA9E1B